MVRAGQLGVYIPDFKKIVISIIKKCFSCLKLGPSTLYSNIRSHHIIEVQQLFKRVSLDIIGPYIVCASNTSRALVKVHSLLAVCISTGLLTQVMLDGADFDTVVRGIWLIQLRYNVQITHLHTDVGNSFLKFGDTALVSTGKPGQGEYLRLFVMLRTIKISGAKGQYSTSVESSVKRIKQL